MSPEQAQQFQIMQQQLQTLTQFMLSFNSTAEIAPSVQRAISQILSTTSTKTPASGTQTVAEAGAATYGVMKPPDGFISIGGLNVPYIN